MRCPLVEWYDAGLYKLWASDPSMYLPSIIEVDFYRKWVEIKGVKYDLVDFIQVARAIENGYKEYYGTDKP